MMDFLFYIYLHATNKYQGHLSLEKISNFLINNEYKEAMKAVKEIFYYDNTYTDKYLYFLLAKLKVNNTYDAYDALNKMRKKDKREEEKQGQKERQEGEKRQILYP